MSRNAGKSTGIRAGTTSSGAASTGSSTSTGASKPSSTIATATVTVESCPDQNSSVRVHVPPAAKSEGNNQNRVDSQQGQNTKKPENSRRSSWDTRLKELQLYRTSFGHCDVPQTHDSGLGTWVSAQRSQYKRFSGGKTSSMTKERKVALDKIGFSWSLRKRYSWDERFTELRNFSNDNLGSCEVPNDGIYKPLWAWCQNQKHSRNALSGERQAMMERIGFHWVEDASFVTEENEQDKENPVPAVELAGLME